MKKLVWLLILCGMSALCQDQVRSTTVSVTDLTAASKLISFAGQIEIRGRKTEGALHQRQNGRIAVRNVSGKPIVALIATIKRGGFWGAEPPILYRHDFFFKPHSFGPNDTIPDIRIDDDIALPQSELIAEQRPYVQANLQFVQFEDGTTWGDTQMAEELFRQRKDVEKFLRDLVDIYESKGPVAFAAALSAQQPPRTSVASVSRRIATQNEKDGPVATIEGVKEHLRIVEERKATGKFTSPE